MESHGKGLFLAQPAGSHQDIEGPGLGEDSSKMEGARKAEGTMEHQGEVSDRENVR